MWLTYAVLAAILWGLNYSLAEKILQSISPFTLLALEMLTGGIFFLILSYFSKLKSDFSIILNQSNVFWLTTAEIVTVVIASYFIVVSIVSKNATVAGIVELIYPIFTILFTWFLFHESHVNIPVLVGGAFIMLGVVIISFA
jgi:drug/metabolite transporter (DMT)-like permease